MERFFENLVISKTFVYNNVPRVVFGVNAVEKISEECKRLNGDKILIVSDKGILKAGLVDRVLGPLEKSGASVTVYSEIASEPTLESVEKAVNFAREGRYNLIIGLGGGSCMDTAKMCAAMLTNPGKPKDYLVPEDRFKQKSVPKIMIPTTAGTGSEVSSIAIVIEEATRFKLWASSPILFADVAIVDPTLTLTCPPAQTAISAMDSLSHSAETAICLLANPISDSLALYAVKLVMANARKAYYNEKDLEARWNLSLAAMFGGIVISYPWVSGPTLGHCAAEALGPKYGIPHGLICGTFLPYVLDFNLPACLEKTALLASYMGVDTKGLSVRETACRAVTAVVELCKDLHIPLSLQELKIPKEDLPGFAEYIVKERQFLYRLPECNPRKLTVKNMSELLDRMWEGRIAL